MTHPPSMARSLCVRFLLATLCCAALGSPALAAPGGRSPDRVWSEAGSDVVLAGAPKYEFEAGSAPRLFQLDDLALFGILRTAPLEFTAAARPSPVVLTLPMPDGSFARFRIAESPVLSDKLAQEHPELKTYVAQGIDDPTHTARLDRTPLGFHAIVVTPDDYIFVDRATNAAGDLYVSFHRKELPAPDGVSCAVDEESAPRILGAQAPPAGADLRTYDLALATTGEFTTFYGGPLLAHAALTQHINQVNAIFEREVAIRFSITCTAIYPLAATDPFTNPELIDGLLLTQSDETLDLVCGGTAYEIGHLFHRRAGTGNWGRGRAQLGTVCGGLKGRAVSTATRPDMPLFVVDLVPHEIAHQFNATHTYNSMAGGCIERFGSSAFEVGAGTTIMSYACGGCTGEDPPGCADPYFHTHSFDEITNYREGSGICGALTATGNTPPVVDAGPDRTIPRGTPFTLTATGSDPDGDALTWNWEEYDLGAASPPLNGAVSGPLFRSFPAMTSPARTFPNLPDLLAGNPTPFEILPTVDRWLTFRATARDNRAGGGGVNYDTVELRVAGAPFVLTSPNGGQSLNAGSTVPVQWQVGGGSVAPSVNILLSTDGGLTFPTTLAAGVPNDGAHDVALPCVASLVTGARIRIEGAGNIFFDVSDLNFTVTPVAAPPAPLQIAVTLNRDFLWPPNRKLVGITATVRGLEANPNASFVLTSITSNEPDTGLPDVSEAAFGTPDTTFRLRSEHSGTPGGRIYTIVYTASDNCGNQDEAIVQVRVAEDRTGHALVAQQRKGVNGQYMMVIVPTVPPISVGGEDPELPVDRSAGSPARRVDPPGDLLVGNTAGVIAPAEVSQADVNADGLPDAIALFAMAAIDALRAGSEPLDGPVGLHYQNALGATFLVPDLLAVPVGEFLGEAPGPSPPPAPIVDVDGASPAVTRLAGFLPNPFFRHTTVAFELARPARATLEVYSPSGARVRGLAERAYDPGRHTVTWDGRDDAGRRVPPGVYFVRFVADGVVDTGKALLLP